MQTNFFQWFEDVDINAISQVGGKNASLGEMIRGLSQEGIRVPGGFATTAQAYQHFLTQAGLDKRIYAALDDLDIADVSALTHTGAQIRQWILATPLPDDLINVLRQAYQQLSARYTEPVSFAVRSSATAEDLPQASFAGQQETFLNIKGEENMLAAIKAVYASLFHDRAIAYRAHHGFAHSQVAVSAGVQKMVRSDRACSGVIFTLDTESGFSDVVLVTSAYGLGETVVQGGVNPDEFYVYKPNLRQHRPAVVRRRLGTKATAMIFTQSSEPGRSTQVIDIPPAQQQQFSLTDAEVESLASMAITIEAHYARPMDIEWAKDADDQQLYIVQARPETVKSREPGNRLERYELQQRGRVLCRGRSIGQRIGTGKASVIASAKQLDRVQPGDVLVTDMTDPDWEPIMKRASAIVTNRGGRTCHAAIVARELGIPAVVGCGNATQRIQDAEPITVSCAEGDDGYIYAGEQPFVIRTIELDRMPPLPFELMLNVGNPERAFDFRALPNAGVGLARLEFIINTMIGIHPKALLQFDKQPPTVQKQIRARIAGYADPVNYYIDKLTEGIATIACAFTPKPVIVRLSDFKSNEYANLIGGKAFEPLEENPMLGFRGASRYVAEDFTDCFALECQAILNVRNTMGLRNVVVMVPFVRTLSEAQQVITQLDKHGLRRGKNDLKVVMMCEIPSNALLADAFLDYFDGFSIGSNDLTQLTLGVDRDSALVAASFDERDAAVKKLLAMAISSCRARGKYIGICGQGPSDHPDLALWLAEQKIETISLNPDSVVSTWLYLAEHLMR
ncbi:MAG: phosphoenolpyruvate synthase [Gammaproteobacteria bacterium]|nr:phosphoenolpyruvate synthase [Gammaproteobacteria bacterium]